MTPVSHSLALLLSEKGEISDPRTHEGSEEQVHAVYYISGIISFMVRSIIPRHPFEPLFHRLYIELAHL